ncbi:hypothetical protein ACP70R_004650 [Stipagrostis hirtigluma subsp. patula]
MRVQAAVAEAAAWLAHHSHKCRDSFAQGNAIRHLVGHLAAGTIQEHSGSTAAAREGQICAALRVYGDGPPPSGAVARRHAGGADLSGAAGLRRRRI